MFSQKFAFLKVMRLIHISLLHKPLEFVFKIYFRDKDVRFIEALVGAFATFSWIMILLHFLGCMWIFIGSDYFIDFEEGAVPWTLDSDDFKDMG